jgi:hypothetical protein
MTIVFSRTSGASSGRIFLFRLPMLLVVLHVLLLVVTGFVWIGSSRQMGAPLAGPEANLWYRVVRAESFPVSYLAQHVVEAALQRIHSGFGFSLSSIYAVGYWTFLLIFGAVQWYLVGSLALTVRRGLGHGNSA